MGSRDSGRRATLGLELVEAVRSTLVLSRPSLEGNSTAFETCQEKLHVLSQAGTMGSWHGPLILGYLDTCYILNPMLFSCGNV